jgi:NAD(P)-dependent dehydrogenase (short-subunit alcohol dehydrogenase family)
MGGRLAGKVAVITGGTSGIGAATVRRFVEEGARVVFSGRSQEAGDALAAELGERSVFIRADVTREPEIKATIGLAVSRFGRLDCLFNNAGGPTRGGVEDVTVEDFRYAMDLLLGSVVFGIKHAAPVMKAQGGGRIVNNSSVAALRTGMGGYLYSAAKAAVSHVSRIAGMELGPYGITVNTISPGAIATPIFFGGSAAARQLEPAHDAAKMRKLTGNLARATPLHRAGFPADIANAVLYLASDEGAYVNCHDWVIDGGMTAGEVKRDGT